MYPLCPSPCAVFIVSFFWDLLRTFCCTVLGRNLILFLLTQRPSSFSNAANFQPCNPIQSIILLVPQRHLLWHWAAGLMPEIHMDHKETVPRTQDRKLAEMYFHGNHTCWVHQIPNSLPVDLSLDNYTVNLYHYVQFL